ncbi:MAG: TSUP family transporter [Candidatus Krumholzibacteriia bacterium]
MPPGAGDLLLAALAGVAAGAVNALAGGGTLITFPTLTALGVPALAANVTNTVALCPGYFGATLAQRSDLRGQGRRLRLLVPAGVLGGLAGGLLLLRSGERTFRELVPFLILLASALLAAQEPLRAWVKRREARAAGAARAAAGRAGAGAGRAAPAVGLAAVYGGYFGAGLSVIVLAALGLVLDDSLTRLNALKQAIALGVNVAAAVLFACVAPVVWPAAAAMAVGALLGGIAGGRLAGRVRPAVLRRIVVVIGVVLAAIYFAR